MPVERAVGGELQHATELWRNVFGRALLLVGNKSDADVELVQHSKLFIFPLLDSES